jgi:hypothetical protein
MEYAAWLASEKTVIVTGPPSEIPRRHGCIPSDGGLPTQAWTRGRALA